MENPFDDVLQKMRGMCLPRLLKVRGERCGNRCFPGAFCSASGRRREERGFLVQGKVDCLVRGD
jgi:hypothetical protein